MCMTSPRGDMANCKAKTITVKFLCTATVNYVKSALAKENGEVNLTVIQDLGAGEFLIEFEMKEEAKKYLDSGVDFHEIHLNCNPPHGYHVNVSILGLPAYVEDEKVIETLSDYGEVKSDVIRYKYHTNHDLPGLENGNRLVRMVLSKVSIPYSLQIDGQWCRIIHNNQQRVCSFCHGVGHSRHKCPEVECYNCRNQGHIACDCELPAADLSQNDDPVTQPTEENLEENISDQSPEAATPPVPPPVNTAEAPPDDKSQPDVTMDDKETVTHDFLRSGTKRHLPTDSDLGNKPQPQCCQRIKPTPNLNVPRNNKKVPKESLPGNY